MLQFLLSLVNPIGSIAREIVKAKAQALDATTEAQRISANVTVEQLQARQALLISEQGKGLTRLIRPAFALPFIIYDFKVLVWDKVLGVGTTDDISPEFWQLQMIIFGAYFLTRGIEKTRM